jgi:hypothetical protein
MRGTLHFVAAADVRWILMLTSPKNIAGSANRRANLGLDDKALARCREIFIKILQGGKQKSRDEMYAALENAGIATQGQRGYHVLWNSALHGLICFASTIVIDGRVMGTWKRTIKKAGIEIVVAPFTALSKAEKKRFAGAVNRYGTFLNRPVHVL